MSTPSRTFREIAAYLVHALTASGAVFGLLSIYAIHNHAFITSFWYLAAAILVDSIDGTFARMVDTKRYGTRVDGALLDNIVDFITYVIAPAFFILVAGLVPSGWDLVIAGAIVMASAYQFTQSDAKTEDHFFKGFPDYWNIVVMYLYVWHTSPSLNLAALAALVILVFVPIKYVYPSRMEFVSRSMAVRALLLAGSVLWGLATGAMLVLYPRHNTLVDGYVIAFIAIYTAVSLYRTAVPLKS